YAVSTLHGMNSEPIGGAAMDRNASAGTRTRRWMTLSALVILSAARAARAGDDLWTPWGPPGSGGGAIALAADPRTPGRLYAAAPPDLYTSGDGGATWTWAGFGLGGARVAALAVDRRSSAVYADSGDALYRSDDGARHWRKIYSKHARAALLGTA